MVVTRLVACAAIVLMGCRTESDPSGETPDANPIEDAATDASTDSSTDMTRTSQDMGSGSDGLTTGDVGDIRDTGVDANDMSAPMQCPPVIERVEAPPPSPPFGGTAFITNDLITQNDPTAFEELTPTGRGDRLMFDRRANAFVTLNAHLFDARFGMDTVLEIQVNPEFDAAAAEREARLYAGAIGQLPRFLFRDLETVWIHDGDEAFGGGNNNLLIHTVRAQTHAANGELEEILVHEAAHTSLDPHYRDDPAWRDAAEADGSALSTYARDNPDREDLAETLGPYLAVRFRPERLPDDVEETIRTTVPNRLNFLDCLPLSMDVVN